MAVNTLFFTFLIALGCLSMGTMASNDNDAMEAGKEFANTLNDSSVKDVAKDFDPESIPNYQGTDIPETDYYESGANIENQASAVAADNPTAQFLQGRPNIQLDPETDPLFVRYNEIKDQAHNLTDTYSDCAALPVGIENNITVDDRPTASCEPGSVHTEGNTSCLCERTVVDTQPLTPDCPDDYSFDDEAENCTSSNVETTEPDLVCESDYHLNADNQCVKHVTDTNQPGLICAAGYTYVSQRNRCEKKETITVVATPTCPSGYTYDAYYNRCQISVLETVSATATCSAGQLVNGTCVESIENCRTDSRAARQCRYEQRTVGRMKRISYYAALSNHRGSMRAGMIWGEKERFGRGDYILEWSTWLGRMKRHEVDLSKIQTTKDNYLYYPGKAVKSNYKFEICRCSINQTISTTPTNTCPADYSYNGSSGRCEKVGTVYQNPGQTCPSGYSYNSSSNLCEKQNTLTQSPTLVCDPPYKLNQSTRQCEHEQTFTEPPEFVCPVGYSLQGESCQKTVITTTQPTYYCEEGYVLNPATNECEEDTFNFSCETTTPARTVELCGQTLMCPDGNCAEEYQVQEDASEDFLKAATGIAVASEIAEQIDQENLTIFEGDSKQCKKKLAGFSNCCKDGGWGTDLGLDNCSAEEKELGLLKEAQRVQYVGRYCSDDSLFGCLAKSSVYCTYPSKLARIIIQQGKAQLNQTFGSATSPNCAGFSVDELESLNFDDMDLSEFYSDVAARDPSTPDSDDLTDDIQEKLKARYEGIQ